MGAGYGDPEPNGTGRALDGIGTGAVEGRGPDGLAAGLVDADGPTGLGGAIGGGAVLLVDVAMGMSMGSPHMEQNGLSVKFLELHWGQILGFIVCFPLSNCIRLSVA